MRYTSATQLVGNTPLLKLSHLCPEGTILAKLEYMNPAGSVKDRAALYMIKDAEEKGLLCPGAVIIEPTSGNTGIALAAIATARGYRCIIVMPDSMSIERRRLMEAYGAELVLTKGALGMQGAIDEALRLQEEIPNSFIPNQFENPANPRAHYETTGPELWQATDGKLDILVVGVGTGGTLTGTARYLKAQNPHIQIVAVEPAASPLLSGGQAGPHGLMGLGANFVPKILDTSLIDRILPVTEEEAYDAARLLGKKEGILVGISSGAALSAALQVAKENPEKTIAVIFPDGGDRYLSTPLFK